MTTPTPEETQAAWEALSPEERIQSALLSVLVHADALVHGPAEDAANFDRLHAAVDFTAALLQEQQALSTRPHPSPADEVFGMYL